MGTGWPSTLIRQWCCTHYDALDVVADALCAVADVLDVVVVELELVAVTLDVAVVAFSLRTVVAETLCTAAFTSNRGNTPL